MEYLLGIHMLNAQPTVYSFSRFFIRDPSGADNVLYRPTRHAAQFMTQHQRVCCFAPVPRELANDPASSVYNLRFVACCERKVVCDTFFELPKFIVHEDM